jgi:hypothetical protein
MSTLSSLVVSFTALVSNRFAIPNSSTFDTNGANGLPAEAQAVAPITGTWQSSFLRAGLVDKEGNVRRVELELTEDSLLVSAKFPVALNGRIPKVCIRGANVEDSSSPYKEMATLTITTRSEVLEFFLEGEASRLAFSRFAGKINACVAA